VLIELLLGFGSDTWGSLMPVISFSKVKTWRLGSWQWITTFSSRGTSTLTGRETCRLLGHSPACPVTT